HQRHLRAELVAKHVEDGSRDERRRLAALEPGHLEPARLCEVRAMAKKELRVDLREHRIEVHDRALVGHHHHVDASEPRKGWKERLLRDALYALGARALRAAYQQHLRRQHDDVATL